MQRSSGDASHFDYFLSLRRWPVSQPDAGLSLRAHQLDGLMYSGPRHRPGHYLSIDTQFFTEHASYKLRGDSGAAPPISFFKPGSEGDGVLYEEQMGDACRCPDGAWYGVPWTWAGRSVQVGLGSGMVEIWSDSDRLALHPRAHRRGQRLTLPGQWAGLVNGDESPGGRP